MIKTIDEQPIAHKGEQTLEVLEDLGNPHDQIVKLSNLEVLKLYKATAKTSK